LGEPWGRWLAAAIAVATIAAPAAAQDKTIDWSGFYIGGGAGYAFGRVNHTFQPGSSGFGAVSLFARDDVGGSFAQGTSGGLIGLHAGYTQQWDRLVGGVEVSFDLGDVTGRTTNAFGELFPTTTYSTSLKWLATITPRLGYAWNDFQFYGKAGLAMARITSSLTADANACGQPCVFTGDATHVGWTVGAGVAYALTPNWILGLEYDYYNLGTENYGGQTAPSTLWNLAYTLQPQFSAMRARISYKFGGMQTAAADAGAARSDPNDLQQRWQGFYVGAHAGYGWSNFAHKFDPGGSGNGGSGPALGLFAPDATGGAFTNYGTGGVYGLHAGYNQQWDWLVGGVEFSFAMSDINGQAVNPFGAQTDPNATYTSNVRWMATLAPRVGVAWQQFLFFGKAGLAVARISSQLNSLSVVGCFGGGFGAATPQGPCSFSEERTHTGVVLGAGFEYQLGRNWILGVEYNYTDLSTESYGGTILPNTTWPLSYTVHPQISIVKGRLSYKL
jgi:outer membrane immunogenic protein